MSITFYYAPATSATRVHWALEELGISYEKVRLDLAKGEQKSPEFLRINPNGKVPALVDDGTPMFESLAIIIHLGEKYGVAKSLWPAPGSAQSAEALMWAVWGTVTVGNAGLTLMANTSERVPAEARNEVQAVQAKEGLERCLAILETRLEGRAWILGDAFTLVDVATASSVAFFARMAGLGKERFPRTAAWTGRATQRPAMAVAYAG
jgi:glutathione S-transferase